MKLRKRRESCLSKMVCTTSEKNFADADSDSLTEVTVVIPAFYGSATISDCLRSVQQALQGRNGEIIVVESSGDGTSDIVQQDFPQVRVIDCSQKHSAGAARNRGVEEARGKLIFFVDQDCVVPANWIDALETHLSNPQVVAAGGSIGIRNPSNLSGCGVYFLEFLTHFPQNRPPVRNANFLIGCNIACRAEIFRKCSFPDQTLGEDALFTHAIRSQGFEFVYDPSLEVKHWNREGWREFVRYNKKMGSAAAVYHGVKQRPLLKPFMRFPWLAFAAPAVILPKIFIGLMASNCANLMRFLLLLPMCLLGNLMWAAAFRRAVLDQRQHHQRDVKRQALDQQGTENTLA